MNHVQDEVGFLLESADFLIQLGDPDRVEGRHSHGRDGDADSNKSFWATWH